MFLKLGMNKQKLMAVILFNFNCSIDMKKSI